MLGQYCRLAPLVAEDHGTALWRSLCEPSHPRHWTYMPYDLPADAAASQTWISSLAASRDPMFHAVMDLEARGAVGLAAFMRIDCANGVIEVGHLNYGPVLQRTCAGTEAIYLMMRRAFDELGFRRLEWKCDSLNAPSRRAAERLGFTFEGVFRSALVRNGAIAIRLGTPSSTAIGQRSKRPSRHGLNRGISTRKAARFPHCRPCSEHLGGGSIERSYVPAVTFDA